MQRALVVKLDLFSVKRAGKGVQTVVFGVIGGDGGGHGLQQGDALQQQGKLAQHAVKPKRLTVHFAGFGDECRAVFLRQNFQQFKQIAIVHRAYHLAHIGLGNAARTHRNSLV